MPQRAISYFQFTGGLNTESSPLTVPDFDATDAQNIIILRNGSVRRKRGFDYLGLDSSTNLYDFDMLAIRLSTKDRSGSTVQAGIRDVPVHAKVVSVAVPGTAEHVDILYVQVGKQYSFYNLTSEDTLVSASASVDTKVLADEPYADMPMLVDNDTILLFRSNLPDTLSHFILVKYQVGTVSPIAMTGTTGAYIQPRMRDLDSNTVDSTVVHNGVVYNCIYAHTNVEPGVDALWRYYWNELGPDPGGSSTPASWSSSTAYETNVILVTDKYDDTSKATQQRFTTAVLASGRLFASGVEGAPASVFFSQSITDGTEYCFFFQAADPRGKLFSSTVASDGGVISIIGCEKILELREFFGGVLIFGTNGVWYIFGDTGFKATSFNLIKISDVGVTSPNSAIQVGSDMMYFGDTGVYSIVRTDTYGGLEVRELSAKIDTLYNDIPNASKETAKVVYNKNKKRVYYLYNAVEEDWQEERDPDHVGCHYRDVLVFDVSLAAWYKWTLGRDATGDQPAIGTVFTAKTLPATLSAVTAASGADTVVDSSGDTVVANVNVSTGVSTEDYVVFVRVDEATPGFSYGFGKLEGNTFVDFDVTSSSSGTDYSSSSPAYIQTSFYNWDDVMRSKQAPYIHCLMKRVENHTLSGQSDTNPGGCFLRVNTDWSTGTAAPGWGDPQQIYYPLKHHSHPVGTDPDMAVAWYKLKLRNFGNAIQLRFESDGDKDFHILGWQMVIDVNRTA